MIKRVITLLVLSFFIGGSFIILSPPSAQAWSGTLPSCNIDLGSINFDWKHVIQTQMPQYDPASSTASVAILKDTNSFRGNDFFFLYYRIDNKLKFDKVTSGSTEYALKFDTQPSHTSFYAQVFYQGQFSGSVGTASMDGQTPGSYLSQFTCVQGVRNVVYGSYWDQPHYQPGDIGTGQPVKCSPLDFGCWLSPIFTGIADTFTAVGQAITQAITTLFSPDEFAFQNFSNNTSAFFSSRLGFLVYPFTFLSGMLNTLAQQPAWVNCGDQPNGNCAGDAFCNRSFAGTLFGGQVYFNFCDLQKYFPSMWSTITLIMQSVTVFLLVFGLRRKFNEVLQK